jgi:hypothetical protein
MKKIYEMPEIEVVTVTLPVIMAGSPGTPNAVIDTTSEVNAEEIESRRHYNVWDEDDEMDDLQ